MTQSKLKHIIFIAFCITTSNVYSQEISPEKDTIEEMFYVSPSYSAQLPFGDMKNNFGFNSMLGLSFNFKSHKNWTYGIEYNYLFGGNIKNDSSIYSGIITSQGLFLDGNGDFAEVKLQERGNSLMLNIGRIFPISGVNQNSGLHVKFGSGWLRHRIKAYIQFDDVPQLAGEYKKLYDRLSSGFTLSQYIGYSHFGNSRVVNFYAGLEVFEAFTVGRRDYQADLMAPYNDRRIDILLGAKVGWMIPFRRRRVSEYYFF